MRLRHAVVWLPLGLALATSLGFAVEKPSLIARTIVRGTPVEVVVTNGKMAVRHNGGDIPVEFVQRPGPQIVPLDSATEIQATEWLDYGIALAIESMDDDGLRSYRWATVNVDLKKHEVRMQATAEFHSSEEDFDILSIRNPVGDSIVILLSRYDREAAEPFATVAFEHHCPRVPVGGMLHRLIAEPLVLEGEASKP